MPFNERCRREREEAKRKQKPEMKSIDQLVSKVMLRRKDNRAC